GRGVMLARGAAEAQAIADTMWNLERDILIQEYVEEARGRDLRVLVIGGQAIAAVRRSARRGAFRSNLHQGGKVSRARLTREAAELAVRAAALCGLEIAGVDLLASRRGLLVLEINAAPGFEGIENAEGKNIAALIVAYIEKRFSETK
ncbi:MAG: 30S ribosomal protein S6--L-glutamate ligase, partial [bacterium]|nr:30S ribosomal protein S6--L-glutamate ligase [bacterium]